MADVSVTAASVLASANGAPTKAYNFGATVTAGQVVLLDSNNKWVLTDASALATTGNANTRVGIALVGGANNQPATVIERDSYFTPGATLANGVTYAVSPNAGAIAPISDITSGNFTTVLGVARSTTILNLNPTPSGIAV